MEASLPPGLGTEATIASETMVPRKNPRTMERVALLSKPARRPARSIAVVTRSSQPSRMDREGAPVTSDPAWIFRSAFHIPPTTHTPIIQAPPLLPALALTGAQARCGLHLRQLPLPADTEAKALELGGQRRLPPLAPGAWWCGNEGNWKCTGEWKSEPSTLATESVKDFPAFLAASACGLNVYNQAKEDLECFSLFGRKLSFERVFAWSVDLLSRNPFIGLTGKKLPYVNVMKNVPGTCVVLSHQQLAYCVVNTLFGNTVDGFEWNGLSARFGAADCCATPVYPQALLAFLASIAASPDGGASTYVAYCLPKSFALDVSGSKARSMAAIDVVDLSKDTFESTSDMMSGLPFVSVTDVAGDHIGGGSALCGIADSQDESLVQFYSDVLFLSFFASTAKPSSQPPSSQPPSSQPPPRPPLEPPMLPANPVSTIFGARRYLNYLSGHNVGSCGKILKHFWNSELSGPSNSHSVPIVEATGQTTAVKMFPQAFVAVTAQGGIPSCKGGFQPLCTSNRSASQRLPQSLTANVQILYAAYEPTNYALFSKAMPLLVKKVGISKFGSGVWWGDSNLFFLVDWIAVSLCSSYSPPTLNYYFYGPYWCENGPNDCFLLASAACQACIPQGQASTYLRSACGSASYNDIVAKFRGGTPQALLAAVMKVLPLPATTQIFEHLAAAQKVP